MARFGLDMQFKSLLLGSLLGISAASNSSFVTGGLYVSNASSVCSSLATKISNPNVTINFIDYVPAGTNLTFDNSGNLSSCAQTNLVASNDLCRIAMKVETSNISEITLETWLPSNWTGRFLSTGNGGLGGCIQYTDINYAAGLGFAAVGANNGHNGTSGGAFYHNSEVVEDFAYRSMHTGVVVGKEISELFYGQTHKKSYYLGCSTGGRQGLKSAQDFPEDFDGIVAGAPAIAFNNLTSWSGHFYTILGDTNSSSFVPTAMWSIIHDEILNQCDGLDGMVDGIIEDPDLCQFRPEALQCVPGNSTNCLTGDQVVAVGKVFAPYYGVDGSLIYPRMQPGSEAIALYLYYSGSSFPYADDWFKYVVFQDPSWDPTTLSSQDAAIAAELNPFNIQTWNGDLSSFESSGGKLLQYHGQMDAIISSDNSPRYYNHVSNTMQRPSSSLDDFYRFFRISGMGHCYGGDGAWQIGQTASGSAGTPLDSENNILVRMVHWVENGAAPEYVTGTKFVNDTVSLGVDFVRKHCKYPTRNTCVDPANYEKPESWKCV